VPGITRNMRVGVAQRRDLARLQVDVHGAGLLGLSCGK
jgi:hypothetical protein